MSYAVKILTPADADTVEAALWYDAQLPERGADYMAEANAAAKRLVNSPEIHRIRFADVRRAPCADRRRKASNFRLVLFGPRC